MIEDYYVDLTLRTFTITQNEMKDPIRTPSDSTFKGVITQASSKETLMFSQYPADSLYRLYCSVDVPITNKSQVVLGLIVYDVVSEPKDTVGRGHHYVTMLHRICM